MSDDPDRGRPVDLSRTLEDLEDERWGPPEYGSHLVTTVHALRHKPIGEFTIGDLRIVIGQRFSLQYLLPIAITHMEAEALAEGDSYPGDLLSSVLHAEEGWSSRPELRTRLRDVAKHALKQLVTMKTIGDPGANDVLVAEIKAALPTLEGER